MGNDVDNAIRGVKCIVTDWGLAVEVLSCLTSLISLAGILTLLSLSPAIRKLNRAILL